MGSRLEAHFLTHKSKLDKVIYSILRTNDVLVAQELYFRISAGEQEFAELARSYSQGPEAQTGGLIGPVELSRPTLPWRSCFLLVGSPKEDRMS